VRLLARAKAARASVCTDDAAPTGGFVPGVHSKGLSTLRNSVPATRNIVARRPYRVAPGSALLLAASISLASCSSVEGVSNALFGPNGPQIGQQGHVSGFLGAAVADEPQAALAARNVLSSGGNAADAAVAAGFMLTVTLPSRAGLGGGGACLAYKAGKDRGGVAEAIMFPAQAPASSVGSDRPAAVPLMARGLFALHARYGTRPFETLISPAETAARFGTPISRALARDLAVVAGPLGGDPVAAAVFLRGGAPLAEGAQLLQPELGGTLAQIRTTGVGDLYQGGLARQLAEVTPFAGGAITMADLRRAVPTLVAPLTVRHGSDMVAFLPPPADGGLAAAAAFQLIRSPADAPAADARAMAVAAKWRATGGDAVAAIDAPAAAGSLPALPASTTLVTLDRDGNAVVCAFSMNNLFGTGRMAQQTGILLGASPAWMPPALLSAALTYNGNVKAFRAAVGGSGQAGAPLATAFAMAQTLDNGAAMSSPVPEPGRANVIACGRYLPDAEGSCGWATDPRGAGLAVGSN
jgi:gamma-glutamyltranspeptidase/glutathione hydrolase